MWEWIRCWINYRGLLLGEKVFLCHGRERVNESRPVQLVHRRTRAAISTVAAVVIVVQNRRAVGHQALDFFPELVERPGLDWWPWTTASWKDERSGYTGLEGESTTAHADESETLHSSTSEMGG